MVGQALWRRWTLRIMITRLCGVRVVARCLVGSVWIALPSILATIPPVLHRIVAASLESPCDLSPPLTHLGHHLLNHLSLIRRDRVVVQCRLQVLMISLSALLGGSCVDFVGDTDPVMWAIARDEIHQPLIFVLRPGAATVSDHGEIVGTVVGWVVLR